MSGGTDVDVLVVGMGPTGVALAGLLGLRGIRTAVFEKAEDLYPLPRAVGMDHEVMRIAQELGVVDELHDHVAPYRPSEYVGVHGELIRRFDQPPPPYRLGWPPMLVFDQPAFERVLRDRIRDMPEVQVFLGTEVTSFGQDESIAWVDVVGADAAARRVTGRYLVGCDGGSSLVRRDLGVGMQDLGFHEPWLVIDALVDDDAALARLPECNVQYCQPSRPGTYVRLIGRHRRWEISLEPDELPVGPVDNDAAWTWLEHWIKPGEATIWRAAAYVFHGLVAERWRYGRVFLAGDAAHMTPPFAAQGMAQGMRDAQNLAWKLTAVLAGQAADSLLDTYQRERRPHVVQTTLNTIELGRDICQRDVDLALVRDRKLLREAGGTVPTRVRGSLIPTLSDGLFATSTPGAGQICPQPPVRAEGRVALSDEVTGAGMRLFLAEDSNESAVAALEKALAPIGGTVWSLRRLGEDEPVLSDWLADLPAVAALVRPDHCVYGTAGSLEDAQILVDQAVRRCLGRDPAVG
ncbi:MAG: bifunctional 3-(3-hydroxy-phenyl)propionate/3-hydroxycinnamic acid hydroxylase [Candidatus Nanopelagicales bacterium]